MVIQIFLEESIVLQNWREVKKKYKVGKSCCKVLKVSKRW